MSSRDLSTERYQDIIDYNEYYYPIETRRESVEKMQNDEALQNLLTYTEDRIMRTLEPRLKLEIYYYYNN